MVLALSLLIVPSLPALAAAPSDSAGSSALIPSPKPPRRSGEALYPLWWGRGPQAVKTTECRNPGKCIKCHRQQATMDPSHAFPCVKCHKGDSSSLKEKEAHRGLIADPGALEHVHETCGKCHLEVVRQVLVSPMALAPRMINQTRFSFGAQKSPSPRYAAAPRGGLVMIPEPSKSSQLVDDLLRRSCLRCHLGTRGSSRRGEARGIGCSACHVPYSNESTGKPEGHYLQKNVGMTACLKCHNSNHVGADYVGLFEKDFEKGFRSPFAKGRQPPRLYGAEQHRLVADVHFRAGMECMDCHRIEEVHGTGKPPSRATPGLQISCEGCHIRGDHPSVLKEEDGTLLLLKEVPRKIPHWNPDSVPHSIPEHRAAVRCSACHAAWSFQDYGFHLMLEERADYWKWAPLAGQNDPQVQELLRHNVGSYVDAVPPMSGSRRALPERLWPPPATRDWLSGEVRPGAWFRGYTARRWESPPLGRDGSGRISVMRPMRQYVVSHVDADSNLLLDRRVPLTGGGFPALIFNPYVPHTTAERGRSCGECHGNPKAAGLGYGVMATGNKGFAPVWRPEHKIPGHSFRWDALVNSEGKPLQRSTRPNAGPLGPGTVKRLLNPSRRQRALWFRFLSSPEERKAPKSGPARQ